MQWRIWTLAAAGKFFEGLVVFMTGVAMPLIAEEFHLTRFQHGVVSAASLFGILIGAIGLGGLADRYGRKVMFIVEMIIFMIFLMLLVASPGHYLLVLFLFGLGLALGCDYPTAHLIISESIPSRARGQLVLAAFGFQALGALVGSHRRLRRAQELPGGRRLALDVRDRHHSRAAGDARPSHHHRERPLAAGPRPACKDAHEQVERLLARDPPYPTRINLIAATVVPASKSVAALFARGNIRATILASVPWFLQDLGTYGIGIFTPTILAATLGHKTANVRSLADLVANDELAARGAALIDVLLIVGILAAIFLVNRVGSIRLQIWGFIGCAAGLAIAAASTYVTGATETLLIFAGFMVFNFMTNMGPNAQTYLLAGEVFPTAVRGTGAGFAAAFAKIGAVMTAFLFPMLMVDVGTRTLLLILVGTSLVGAVITFAFRIETTGVNLEHIGADAKQAQPVKETST